MFRLLVAAGAVAADRADVPIGVRLLFDAASDVLVVAPTLPTRIDWITSDTDRAKVQADRRLRAVLGQLEELGVDAEGTVASDEPIEALEDGIRDFSPDHLLIAMRAADRAGWQERHLLEEIQQRFGIPMTVFQLPAGR
jgi:hypothetical protein